MLRLGMEETGIVISDKARPIEFQDSALLWLTRCSISLKSLAATFYERGE
jgi:hypothetical protein